MGRLQTRWKIPIQEANPSLEMGGEGYVGQGSRLETSGGGVGMVRLSGMEEVMPDNPQMRKHYTTNH